MKFPNTLTSTILISVEKLNQALELVANGEADKVTIPQVYDLIYEVNSDLSKTFADIRRVKKDVYALVSKSSE